MAHDFVMDAEHAALYQDFAGTVVTLSLSTTTARTAALNVGRYRIVADIDCYIAQGADDAITATTSSSFLPGGVIDYLVVGNNTNDSVAGITAAGSGTLFLTPQLTDQP